MNNLEKIRAMTDAELAAYLMKAHDCALYIPFCKNKEECFDDDFNIPEERCMVCMMEWLQQPAEE